MTFNDMNALEQLDYIKRLWVASMPPGISTPADYTLISWIDNTETRQLERVVIQTGKKMSKNFTNGTPLVPDAAARYCSSVLAHYRRNRHAD